MKFFSFEKKRVVPACRKSRFPHEEGCASKRVAPFWLGSSVPPVAATEMPHLAG